MSSTEIEQTTGFAVSNHVSDHGLYLLMLANGLAKGDTFHGVFGRMIDTTLHKAYSAGSNRETAVIESRHGDLEAIAYLAEHIGSWNADFVEKERSSIRSTQAELAMDGLSFKAFGFGVYDKAADAFVAEALVDGGKDQCMRCNCAARDPGLAAGKNIVATIFDCAGLLIGSI